MSADFHQLTTFTFPQGYVVPIQEQLRDSLHDKLFKPIDQPEFLELGFGACDFDDFMSFGSGSLDNAIRGNEYLAFGFRLDKRGAPAGAVERRHRELIAAYLEAKAKTAPRHAVLPGTGVADVPLDAPKMSKEMRRELRQVARSELICKAPPNPKHVPVVIDLPRGRVYVGSTSAPVLRAFEAMMCGVLGTYLIPLDPLQRLALEELAPHDTTYLPGLRFLTWLWRRIVQFQEREDPMELVSPVSREPDQVLIRATAITLEQGDNGGRDRLSAQGRDAATWEEVETAIRQGRSVSGLGLVMQSYEDVYHVETTAAGLSIRALKLPKLPRDEVAEDAYGGFLLRMVQVRAVTGYLDDLWSIWVAQQRADAKLVPRQRHADELPVGFARAQALADAHRDLFAGIGDAGIDRVTMTFGGGNESVLWEREPAQSPKHEEDAEEVMV